MAEVTSSSLVDRLPLAFRLRCDAVHFGKQPVVVIYRAFAQVLPEPTYEPPLYKRARRVRGRAIVPEALCAGDLLRVDGCVARQLLEPLAIL